MPAPAAGPFAVRLALLAAAGAGAALAGQQRLNAGLQESLGDALVVAALSFGTGLACLVVVVATRPRSRRALAALPGTRWWERLGGLGGAALVAVGAAAAPVLGVALLSVGLVAGQTSGALATDRAGLGPAGRLRLTGPRLAGAALCLLAVAVSLLGSGARQVAPLLLVLVVAAGVGSAVQQALNGRVRSVTGDAAVAGAVNFTVGLAALCVGLLARAAAGGLDVGAVPGLAQWYLYLGGPMGAVSVAVAAAVVGTLGVLRLGLAVVAGQLGTGVLLDVAAPPPNAALSPYTVLGAVLTMVAVGISGLPGRPARGLATSPR